MGRLRLKAASPRVLSAVVLAFALCAKSQEPPDQAQVENAMRAQATQANVQDWLQSKDPRLIAWGAYFAAETADPVALELAAQQVKKSLYSGGLDIQSLSGPQHDAMAEILGALIQRNVPVSAELLGYFGRAFPVQSVILASRLPASETSGLLMQWYYGRLTGYPDWLARTAAMFLSKSPPPNFAASMLGDSEEQLVATVVTASEHSGFGSGGDAIGECSGVGFGHKPDWPRLFSYSLEENSKDRVDPLLIEAGGDRITWRPAPATTAGRSCYLVEPLSSETRHRLIAGMLGIPDSAMPWPLRKEIEIVWTSKEQFQRDLGAAVEAEEAKLRQTVQDFQNRNLVTPEEAKVFLPKLTVRINFSASIQKQKIALHI
jgi:hypothetical protein